MVVGVVLVLAALLWGAAILLYILAFALPIAGIFLGVRSFQAVGQSRRMSEELDGLIRDVELDLDDALFDWEHALSTKGIGTDLEAEVFHGTDAVDEMRQELRAARGLLNAASSPEQKIESVRRADRVRQRARRQL